MIVNGLINYQNNENPLALDGAILNPAKPNFYIIYNNYLQQEKPLQHTHAQHHDGLDNLFGLKKKLTLEELSLIKQDMKTRRDIAYDHLSKLYDELLKIDNWRLARPFPDFYLKDKLWWDMNKSELQIRDQIRRENKDLARDLQFDKKDLRSSVMDYKKQEQKELIFGETLEGLV